MVAPARRHIDIDEAPTIVDNVSAKYGHDDKRIAINFAHKVGAAVERLGRAMDALQIERDKDVAETIARIENGAEQK
jgi:hypothetical protein